MTSEIVKTATMYLDKMGGLKCAGISPSREPPRGQLTRVLQTSGEEEETIELALNSKLYKSYFKNGFVIAPLGIGRAWTRRLITIPVKSSLIDTKDLEVNYAHSCLSHELWSYVNTQTTSKFTFLEFHFSFRSC